MFKRTLTSLIVFCMVIVQANATTHNGLKAAFDDLSYALNVEWDQNDRYFYNSEVEKFKTNLKTLQDQGLTNKELIKFTLSQVKDEKVAKDLETAFSMVIINKMPQAEAQKFVVDVLNKTYGQGASWNGQVIGGIVAFVIIVAVVAIIAGKARVDDGCYEVWTCEEYCSAGVCYEDCDYRCVN